MPGGLCNSLIIPYESGVSAKNIHQNFLHYMIQAALNFKVEYLIKMS